MISCHGWARGTRFFLSKDGRLNQTLEVHIYVAAVLKPRHTAHVVEVSGPGPDASKQLAARDGDLSAFQTMVLANIRKSTLHFLFLRKARLLLSRCIAQLVSWLAISRVSRVACDLVSRLGGWDTIFSKEPHLCGSGAQASTWIPYPSVLAHGTSLSSAHVVLWGQAQVRTPPSNWLHEMAT